MKRIFTGYVIAVLIITFLAGAAYSQYFVNSLPEIDWVNGPKTLELADGAIGSKIKAGYVFADAEQTAKYLKHFHAPRSGSEVGLIMSSDESQEWFILLDYKDVGYIKEEMLQQVKPEDFLKGVKMKTDQERIQKGFYQSMNGKLDITGFIEEPYMDINNKVYSAALKLTQGKTELVNYVNMIFGRKGVFVIRLVCKEDEFEGLKPIVQDIVNNTGYYYGYKYSEFEPGKDKVAFEGASGFFNALLYGSDPGKSDTKQAASKTQHDNKTSNSSPPLTDQVNNMQNKVNNNLIIVGGLIALGAIAFVIKKMLA